MLEVLNLEYILVSFVIILVVAGVKFYLGVKQTWIYWALVNITLAMILGAVFLIFLL